MEIISLIYFLGNIPREINVEKHVYFPLFPHYATLYLGKGVFVNDHEENE